MVELTADVDVLDGDELLDLAIVTAVEAPDLVGEKTSLEDAREVEVESEESEREDELVEDDSGVVGLDEVNERMVEVEEASVAKDEARRIYMIVMHQAKKERREGKGGLASRH